MFKKLIIYSFFILSSSILCGCGLETYQSGDLPSQKRLEFVKPGFTQAQTVELLGEPSFQNKIGPDNFYIYSKSIKKSRAFLDPKEIERDIYVISFDEKNTVTNIQHLTLADGHVITYNKDTSPVKGKELSVLEQLVKNFGRYDAGGRDSSVRQ
ncbi:MAG: outer membrane protein assembly factor BamE [Alphaproteobacteria bacterium]|nr:outer membrane protein assembly factor BamE [Alphaproteobacteria bacterium]